MSLANSVATSEAARPLQRTESQSRLSRLRAVTLKVAWISAVLVIASILFTSIQAIQICSATLKANFCPEADMAKGLLSVVAFGLPI